MVWGIPIFASVWTTAAWLCCALFSFVWLLDLTDTLRGGVRSRAWVVALQGNYYDEYRRSLGLTLDAVSRWVGDGNQPNSRFLSGQSFLTCFGLAAFYPVYFLAFSWAALGTNGTFLDVPVLYAGATGVVRESVLQWIIVPPAAAILARVFRFSAPTVYLVGWSTLVGLVIFGHAPTQFAAPLIVFVVLVMPLAAVSAVTFGPIGGVFAAVMSTFAIGMTVAIDADLAQFGKYAPQIFVPLLLLAGVLVGVFLSSVLTKFDRWGLGWVGALLVWICVVALPIGYAGASGASWFSSLGDTFGQTSTAPLLLFFCLLPAINAVFDWLSLGTTRLVVRGIVTMSKGHSELVDIPLGLGGAFESLMILLNLVLVSLLGVAIAVGTAFGVELFSVAHEIGGGRPLFDVGAAITQIREDPWSERWWWLYGMMFSTLLPTLAHFFAYAGALLAGVIQKFGLGNGLVDWIILAREKKSVAAAAGSSFFLAMLTLAPAPMAILLVYQSLVFSGVDTAWVSLKVAELADQTTALVRPLRPTQPVYSLVGTVCRDGNHWRATRTNDEVVDACTEVIDQPELQGMGRAIALLQRAKASFAKDDYDLAWADLNEVIALQENYAEAYYVRGSLNRILGHYSAAIADLGKAITLYPKYQSALTNRALLHWITGEIDLALTDLDSAISLNPNSSTAYAYRGWVQASVGEYDAALLDLDHAVQIDEDYPDPIALGTRGDVLMTIGRYEQAMADFDRAVSSAPWHYETFMNRGYALWKIGEQGKARADYGKALTILETWIKDRPKNPELIEDRAVLLSDLGDFNRALADFSRVIALRPDSSTGYSRRCRRRAVADREYEDALADCNRALLLLPKSAITLETRALVHFRMGQFTKAIGDCDAALKYNSRSGSSLFLRGLAKSRLGNAQEAISDFAQAESINTHIAREFAVMGLSR